MLSKLNYKRFNNEKSNEMKKETAYELSMIAAGLLIGVVFAVNFLSAMYAASYLLPDRPGVALLSGFVAGVGAVFLLGWIFRADNNRI